MLQGIVMFIAQILNVPTGITPTAVCISAGKQKWYFGETSFVKGGSVLMPQST